MSLGQLSAADRHREIAAGFTRMVEGTTNWDALTPVPEWAARDVVRHLTTWLPALLGEVGLSPAGPGVDVDPVATWRSHADAVQELIDDPAGRTISNPHFGEMALEDVIDRLYTSDIFMHTADLALATGQKLTLEPEFCQQLLDGMAQMEAVLRGSGQYGAPVDVPEGADAQTRLIAFIGRDPFFNG